MNYCMISPGKLKTMGNISASASHNFRERQTLNADPKRTHLNKTTGAQSSAEVVEAVKARLSTLKKVRKNGVLAIEYFIGASPEFFRDSTEKERERYFDDAEKWLRDRHGSENVVSVTRQYDETSPHICAYVVPIDPKGKLNASHWLDGPTKMRTMHTQFAKDVGAPSGLQRGIEGSLAKHIPIKTYYTYVNKPYAPMPAITIPAPRMPKEPKRPPMIAFTDAQKATKASHEKWQQAWIAGERQGEQRQEQIDAWNKAAGQLVRPLEAKAREGEMLALAVRNLKTANSAVVAKLERTEKKLAEVAAIAELFTPSEIERAQSRKIQQDALAAKEAAEAAKMGQIDRQRELVEKAKQGLWAEFKRRVANLAKLLKNSGGAPYTLAQKGIEAIRLAGDDPAAVDWKAVEKAAIAESLVKGRQKPADVIQAVIEHSPGCADPANHDGVRERVKQEMYRVGPQVPSVSHTHRPP